MNIITGFEYIESLLHDFLRVVPFEADNANGKMQPKHVWSPQLATILQETCSQLDSYCRHELTRTNIPATKGKNHDIKDYERHFGPWLSARKLVFWHDEDGRPVNLQPYEPWAGTGSVPSPQWWQAYNKVKHDRIQHKKLATLRNCVDALAGLFLVIIRLAGQNQDVQQMLAASSWWRVTGLKIGEICENNDIEIWKNIVRYNVVETELFSFPLGWWHDDLAKEYLIQTHGKVRQWGGFDTINDPAQSPVATDGNSGSTSGHLDCRNPLLR